ncbi:MAG: hypothetical protein M1812_000799 [Candelaria pacifica]|nr:MAG: hypothetical protein M1812_000799 [Candelaria pacifica]
MWLSARITLVVSIAATLTTAQFGNQTIDPSSVSLSTRQSWCVSETNTCKTLCGGNFPPDGNSCDSTKLTYTCVCLSSGTPAGLVPGNFSGYYGTLPYFICETYLQQCVTGSANNIQAQVDCRNYNKCGSLNATKAEIDAGGTSATTSRTAISTITSSRTSLVVQTGDNSPTTRTALPIPTLLPSSSSTAAAASSNSGLSTGVKAGIGVGVPIGVLLLAGLGWLIYRSRRKTLKVENQESSRYEKAELESTPVTFASPPPDTGDPQPHPYELEAAGRYEVEGNAHHPVAPAAELNNRVVT